MFEEIRVDFQNKLKKLNHRNVTSFTTLNQQLKKVYQLNYNSIYSLWYQDEGELMSLQNEYDFSLLEGHKKLKIIVLAEQQITKDTQQSPREKKLQQVKPKKQQKLNLYKQDMNIVEQQGCECELLRTSGFTQMLCLYCEKKQIKEAKSQQKERSIPKSQKKQQKPYVQPAIMIDHHKPPPMLIQKPPRPIYIQNKPQIKIHIEPGKQAQFKQNQQKIKQYLDLLSTHQPIKPKDSHKFTNLTQIAKLVMNYQPQQPQPKMGGFGKQLSQKYQMMQQIFAHQSQQELLQFIENNMQVPMGQLPSKYQKYKHWC